MCWKTIIVDTLLCKNCSNPEVATDPDSGKARCKACGERCRDRDFKEKKEKKKKKEKKEYV